MGTANLDAVGSILKIFSNEEQIDLIKIIANNGGGNRTNAGVPES